MDDDVKHGGLGLPMVLFLIFLVLRLTDNIQWAWYWVAAPLWIPIGIGLLLLTFGGICLLVGTRSAKDSK